MDEAQKLISEHQLVNIDNYIYVVDGVCVIIEPDSLGFTDVRQLQDLFQYVAVFKTDSFLNERRGKNNTYIHISGYANELEKAVGFGDMRNIPKDKLNVMRRYNLWICKCVDEVVLMLVISLEMKKKKMAWNFIKKRIPTVCTVGICIV